MRNLYFLILFGVFWGTHSNAQKEIISDYIQNHLEELKLAKVDASNFNISSSATLSNNNYKVYYLLQVVNGYPLSNKSATVVMFNDQIKSFKHNFIENANSKVSIQSASVSPVMAANYAINHLDLATSKNVKVVNYETKKDITKEDVLASDLKAPLSIIQNADGEFVLTYEIIVKTNEHWWVTKINATNGNIESKFDAVISCNFDGKVDDKIISDHKKHSHRYENKNQTISIPNVEKFTSEFFKSSNNSQMASMPPLPAVNATYNAYPLKVETPSHGNRSNLVNPWEVTPPSGSTVPSPFGWHDFEETQNVYIQTTKTQGNNVEAYEDVADNNGPGDFAEATVDGVTGDLTFNFPLDLNLFPDAYQEAAITNLFVWNNFMHDFSYAYGFDETNGNFQQEDYDRFDNVDGLLINDWDGDEVNAEAQDGSGLNNANMSTLVDGFEPRMQMFLWGASPFGDFFEVIEPTDENSFLGTYFSTRFPFFPIPRDTDPPVEAQLVLVQDDGLPYTAQEDGGTPGPSTNLSDGCTGTGTSPETQVLVNAADINGNIAVVRRGVCTFVRKITLAQNSGAIGVIIVNNDDANPNDPVNGGGEAYIPITVPTVSLSFADGEALIAKIGDTDADGTIDASPEVLTGKLIDRGPESNLINRDGDLDQGIIAHEYAHGISNRLVGGRKAVGCLIGAGAVKEEQMGEGWSDFFGLVTTHNIVLNPNPEDPRGIGTYVQFQSTDGPGIRPAPYSTDFAINDYTYGDIADTSLTVPHGVGFVWATMLWDLYWAFIDEYGYDPDIYYGDGGNNKVMQLVMDGMKLIPCAEVGFVEGRDAIIAADEALNGGINQCLIRNVFAKRGVGALAFQGSADSRSDQIENFDLDGGTFLVNCGSVLNVSNLDKPKFIVYPNPVNSIIYIASNINYGLVETSIIDINGRILSTQSINLNNSPSLDISNLADGIYILTIKTSDNKLFTQKIIKR